jgi:hypothetical protein
MYIARATKRAIKKIKSILFPALWLLFIFMLLKTLVSKVRKSSHKHTNQDQAAKIGQNKGQSFINYIKGKNKEFGNYSKPDSSYKCLGKQNVFGEFDRRGCIFKNVCYRKSEKKFEFYDPTYRPVFYDKKRGPLFGFGQKFISISALWFFRDFFSPVVVFKDYPMTNTAKLDRIQLDKLHVFWSRKNLNLSV